MSVTLEIPADVLSSMRVPPQEVEERLRLELAVALYAQNLLASGKACSLAGLTRLEWETVLGQRATPAITARRTWRKTPHMPTAVSDSSVLIHVSGIGQFALLPAFSTEVRLPDAVWRQVVVLGRSHQVVKDVRDAANQGWLKVSTPGNVPLIQTLRTNLHDGEAESIALAGESAPDFLLMDESNGRDTARQPGVQTRGVVGLLIQAKQMGPIKTLQPWLTRLTQTGFHLAPSFTAQVLKQAGE